MHWRVAAPIALCHSRVHTHITGAPHQIDQHPPSVNSADFTTQIRCCFERGSCRQLFPSFCEIWRSLTHYNFLHIFPTSCFEKCHVQREAHLDENRPLAAVSCPLLSTSRPATAETQALLQRLHEPQYHTDVNNVASANHDHPVYSCVAWKGSNVLQLNLFGLPTTP